MKIAIVGCGQMGSLHALNLSNMDGVEVSCVCDIDARRSESLSKTLHVRSYTQVDKLLQQEDIDAAFVAIPPDAHGTEIELARSGVNLFIEKPVSNSLQVAKDILNEVQRARVTVHVGYMWRQLKIVEMAKKILTAEGPCLMTQGFWVDPPSFSEGHWWLQNNRSGGQLVEEVTHMLDLVRYLVGEPKTVACQAKNFILGKRGSDVNDCSLTTFELESGGIGCISATAVSPVKTYERRIDFLTEGFRLDLALPDWWVETKGGVSGRITIGRQSGQEILVESRNSFLEEERAFVQALETRETSMSHATYEDSIKTLAFSLAAAKAAQTGRTVSVQEILEQ